MKLLLMMCSLMMTTACQTLNDNTISNPVVENAWPCEFDQTSWCLITGSRLSSMKVLKDGRTEWTLAGGFWVDNPGIILEPSTCRSKKSDTVALKSNITEILYQGHAWRKATIVLFKDGNCDIDLLVPVSVEPLTVEGVIQSTIAICMKDKLCSSDSALSRYVRPFR